MIALILSVCATIVLLNSFVPRLVSKLNISILTEMITCPVCLGYHVGYVSFLISGDGVKSFAYAFATSFMSLFVYKASSIMDSLEIYIDSRTRRNNGM